MNNTLPGESLPTHQALVAKMVRLGKQRGLFNHSLLLYGPPGAGHRQVALEIARTALCPNCTNVGFGACGQCKSCRQITEGHHPDLIWIEPQSEGRALPNITIETLRNLQDRMVLEPFSSQRVVGCVYEVDKMRQEAANSLLKLVEEPPAHALFLLVTTNRDRILPTIRSRCLHLPLLPPAPEYLVEELYQNGVEDLQNAHQLSLYCLNEGLSPEDVDAESQRNLREKAFDLMQEALAHGEQSSLPALKEFKGQRDKALALLAIWRDLLRDALALQEGRSAAYTYQSQASLLKNCQQRLSDTSLVELMQSSFEYEEAISSNANPTYMLGCFLSALSEKSG